MKYFSTYNTDDEILQAFNDIYLKGCWYQADITYSKGIFYNKIKKPNEKYDLIPLFNDVIEQDSQLLDKMENNSYKSIVFDPPFLFRNRKAENNDKMCARFSYFKNYDDLLLMYENTLKSVYTKLSNGGYLFFKCQDMTDGKFYCTHYEIIKMALKIGYQLKDIGIKISKTKLQREAKQQNCLAKTHSYWLVFKKQRGVKWN